MNRKVLLQELEHFYTLAVNKKDDLLALQISRMISEVKKFKVGKPKGAKYEMIELLYFFIHDSTNLALAVDEIFDKFNVELANE